MSKILKSKFKVDTLLQKIRINKKIILCHGVFDILHLGHLKYFEDAKSYGDILIVSVTADKFVKNKYFSKPYFNTNQRIETLKYIQLIDYILVSNSVNAVNSIKSIKPDFYIKGPDYKNNKKDKELNLEIAELKKNRGKFITTSSVQFSSSNILFNRFDLLNVNQKKYLSNLKRNSKISDFLDKMSINTTKILVLGETIIDRYIESKAVGTSSKEPILTSKVVKTVDHFGGVLNVANHLRDFAKKVNVLSALSDDKNTNNLFIKKINKEINFQFIEKSNSPIITKTRFIESYSKSKMFGSYDLNDGKLRYEEEKNFINKLNKLLPQSDLVFLMDYGHGIFSKKIINTIIKKSKFLCINKQLNSNNKNQFNLQLYNKSELFCIQESELRFEFKDQDTDILLLSKKFYKSKKFKILIVTLGSNGCILINKNKIIQCPAFDDGKIIDRVGSGDTFLAIAGLLLHKKIDEKIVLLASNIAAGEKISILGNSFSLTKEMLINKIKNIMK